MRLIASNNRKEKNMDSMELPKYSCHKEVHAAKITAIDSHESDGTGHRTMVFGDIGSSKFMTDAWAEKHNPEVGGYFVVYKDGYTSYSPAEAFEEGYTSVNSASLGPKPDNA